MTITFCRSENGYVPFGKCSPDILFHMILLQAFADQRICMAKIGRNNKI